MTATPQPDPTSELVRAMRAITGQRPGMRFVLAMDDRDNAERHGILTANCTEPEAVHVLSLALARLTNPNRRQKEEIDR
ncbi:hypothetical protein ABZ863_01750 [Saccharomonospora sp. NPDC046836]|uniref:hypothetical protein n=1 Tax=Saccharomonospora sp. NPDC046836 TaxID=3156921 RepID=UPI0033D8D144